MKVSEAKEKVCPFMSTTNRVISFNNNGYNHRVHENEAYNDFCKCITKHCMAWTYVQTHERIENTTRADGDETKCAAAFVDGKELPEDEKEGICRRLR